MNKLKEIFKRYKYKIIASYALLVVSNFLMFLYPKILGNTIDKLIAGDYYYIINLALVFLGFVLTSLASNVYDTIVFSKIKKDISKEEIVKMYDNNIDDSTISGRYSMLDSIVSFFENDISILINFLLGSIGSLFIIFGVNHIMGFGLVFSSLIILCFSMYYSPKLSKLTIKRNNLHEKQVSVINKRITFQLERFLLLNRKISIKFSNISSKYNMWIQVSVYFTVTALLFYYISCGNVTVGSTFSTYRYMFDFCNSVLMLPHLFITWMNLKDVLSRLSK
jgi:ABC-type multidrug transport system fused ATPase/permease subunit